MENNKGTKAYFGVKADAVIKFLIRWTVFFSFIFALLIAAQIWVKKTAAATLASVPVIEIPSFDAQTLLNDLEARKKFLDYRVDGTRFYLYKIKKGDNLWKLAAMESIDGQPKSRYSVHTILGCNPQLGTYDVYIGQTVLIPSSGGTLHPVQENDGWTSIAAKYDIEEKTLTTANFSVKEPVAGEYVFIPGKRPAVDLMNEKIQEKYALRELFSWPLSIGGRISSNFGLRKRHPVTGRRSMHGGTDIAVPSGTPVAAAADGVVILAGSGIGHYGTAVYIDHRNGYVTHYGHLSSYNVKAGQKVRAGQMIGRSGASGRVTGPHLHFTVKKGDKAIDPMKFLW